MLRKAAGEALSLLGLTDAEVSVLVTGDRKMRTLNRCFRGKDDTTDVLSFPAGPVEGIRRRQCAAGPPAVLGDVVISAPRAMAQADRHGHTFERELVFLLVHGILHLAGYDHEKGPSEDRAMRRKQREFMARLKAT
jgi:probable rRNA maturation factor